MLLALALSRPEIIDGVLQGEAVRLVVKEGAPAPTPQELESAAPIKIAPAKPRFEDAFVAMLGGQPKRTLDLRAARQAASKEGAAVEAVNLTKKVGDFTAADRITFSIKRGEIFGLLGPNGAGKSTTFKMMCGLLRPTGGTALVDGYDLYRAPSAARARLGYMAQKFSLYGDLSVRQNLDFFAGAYGLWGAKKRDAVDRVVAAFDLVRILASTQARFRSGSSRASRCPARSFTTRPFSSSTSRHPASIPSHGANSGAYQFHDRHGRDRNGDDPLHGRSRILRPRRADLSRREHRHRYARGLAGPRANPALPNPTLEDAFIALIEAQDRREAA